MKKIIINMLLSVCFIHLHAQTGLPYKSLSDFKNDTTAFINYNFIDRAEQYKGKTLEFIVHDLQIAVKHTLPSFADRQLNIGGLFLNLYDEEETRIVSESTLNKPHTIFVKWEGKAPLEEDYYLSLLRLKDYNKIINHYKDFRTREIIVLYPSKSEYEQHRSMLRSTKIEPNPHVRINEKGEHVYDLME